MRYTTVTCAIPSGLAVVTQGIKLPAKFVTYTALLHKSQQCGLICCANENKRRRKAAEASVQNHELARIRPSIEEPRLVERLAGQGYAVVCCTHGQAGSQADVFGCRHLILSEHQKHLGSCTAPDAKVCPKPASIGRRVMA